MKTITLAAVLLCMSVALVALAASPIPVHPPVPAISAVKAIELAVQFTGAATNASRHCSSIVLNEGGMTPAPRGSARHWVVTFQDAGGDRGTVTHVYVDMEGRASDAVPPMNRQESPNQAVERYGAFRAQVHGQALAPREG
jgi:hypothetical protein